MAPALLPAVGMNRRTLRTAGLAAAVGTLVLVASPEARADRDSAGTSQRGRDSRGPGRAKVGFDLDPSFPVDASALGTGLGGQVRLGYELEALVLSFTPELAAGYYDFGGSVDPSAVRGMGGGRLAFGAFVRPVIFAHAGVARVWAGDASRGVDPTRTAPAFDGGLALDLTALPVIDLGIHAAYNVITSSSDAPSARWITTGVHVAFVF